MISLSYVEFDASLSAVFGFGFTFRSRSFDGQLKFLQLSQFERFTVSESKMKISFLLYLFIHCVFGIISLLLCVEMLDAVMEVDKRK